MSRKTGEGHRRGEVCEKVTQTQDGLREKLGELELERDDVLITRETLEQLEGGGTQEGMREVFEAVERGEDAAAELFERDGERLETISAGGEDYQSGIRENGESVERDAERLLATAGRINTQENVRELEQAHEHALRDKEFLERQIEILEEAIRQSRQNHEALSGQVRGPGGMFA